MKNHKTFLPNQKVTCIDAELSVGGLTTGEEYIVLYQTLAGYVWVDRLNAPYMPDRFK